ncbi:MAG: tetratricopeptide repeat-containing sensor histidine kinase [Bacteroidales bacterium]|nr:tetratricopeptide repeat-containing sensor histidine kinase [Bacteroidales bacterium]
MKLKILFLLILTHGGCYAFNLNLDTIDSLLNVYTPKSKDKYHFMLLKGKEMKYVNPLGSLTCFQNIIRQSSVEDKFIKGLAWEEIGNIFFYLGFTDSAFKAYKKSFAYYLAENCYPCFASLALEVAKYKKRLADYPSALQFCLIAIQIAQQTNQIKIIGKSYVLIGSIYLMQQKYQEALKFMQKAISIFNKDEFIKEKIMTYINIAGVYRTTGRIDDAFQTLQKSYEIASKNNFKREMAVILNNLADIHLELGKYDEAIRLLSTAFNFEEHDAENSCIFHMNLGIAYMKKNQLYESEKHLLKSLEILFHLKNLNLLAKTYALLSDLYVLKHDYQKAYQYKNQQKKLEDSLCFEQNAQMLKATEEKFKIKELENENKLLRQQQLIDQMKSSSQEKNFIMLVVLLFLALLALGFLIFLNRMQKKHELTLNKYNKELLEKNALLAKQKLDIAESILVRDKLFSIISHDLRNPMASLISFARIIRRDYQKLTPKELEVLVSEMEKVVNKMSDLLENLLLWYRTQGDKWISQPTVIHLQNIIQKVIEYYEKSFQLKNISVDITLDKEPTIVYADEKMLETILRNLVSNAIKYTPENGKVFISSTKHENEYIIQIQDTGIGMDQDKISEIMSNQPIESTPGTAGEKGSGLGLYIVKELIDKNKGRFWIESTLGKGTSFYFTLPAFEDKA